jgi:hypothetical protein
LSVPIRRIKSSTCAPDTRSVGMRARPKLQHAVSQPHASSGTLNDSPRRLGGPFTLRTPSLCLSQLSKPPTVGFKLLPRLKARLVISYGVVGLPPGILHSLQSSRYRVCLALPWSLLRPQGPALFTLRCIQFLYLNSSSV